MPKRKHYPKEIELKVPNEPDSFGTQTRYEVAQVLLKYWNPDEYNMKDYPELAKQEGYDAPSRTYFTDVWKDYFGPVDDMGWTFREIFDQFEEYTEYIRFRDMERAREEGRKEALEETMQHTGQKESYSPQEVEAFQQGMIFMFELLNRDGSSPSF